MVLPKNKREAEGATVVRDVRKRAIRDTKESSRVLLPQTMS
jgi:hypothetical protein